MLLQMPAESRQRAFVVSITITSEQGRRALVYFGAETPLPMQRSEKVTTTHRGAPFQASSTIQVVTAATVPVRDGVGVFQRLLIGKETLVLEQQGRIILEPGEAIGVWFEAMPVDDEIDVAFGWWEEP